MDVRLNMHFTCWRFSNSNLIRDLMQLQVSWYVCCRASSMRCLWYAPARFPQMKMITLARIWGHKEPLSRATVYPWRTEQHHNAREQQSSKRWFCLRLILFLFPNSHFYLLNRKGFHPLLGSVPSDRSLCCPSPVSGLSHVIRYS